MLNRLFKNTPTAPAKITDGEKNHPEERGQVLALGMFPLFTFIRCNNASPLKIEYESAWYHVMNRGANHRNIYLLFVF